MKLLRAIVLLGGVVSLATFAAAQSASPAPAPVGSTAPAASAQPNCNLGEIASLDLQTEPDGSVSIPVLINDQREQLIVDTGAFVTVVSYSVARELSLKPSLTLGIGTIYGGLPLFAQGAGKSLQVGNLHATNPVFTLGPDSIFSPDAVGLFGTDIMANFDIEIDYAGAKLGIFEPHPCPGMTVYWTKGRYAQIPMKTDEGSHIAIPVMLDGKQLLAVFDTGDDETTMTLETAKSIFGITDTNPALKSGGEVSINGMPKAATYHYPFATMTFEGVSVINPDIVIIPERAAGKGAPQLLLGNSVLRQLHLYIAYKEQMLYVTPAEER